MLWGSPLLRPLRNPSHFLLLPQGIIELAIFKLCYMENQSLSHICLLFLLSSNLLILFPEPELVGVRLLYLVGVETSEY